jgi:molybdopterin molybdotransferase
MALPLTAAQDILLKAATALEPETVALAECWRRVLARDVTADIDFPPFDRSPLDGYALIAAEVAAATSASPVWLQVVDDIPAGSLPRTDIRPGTAARIMTGAPVPAGATGVVRLEDTREENGRVAIMAGTLAGRNICRRGEEIAAGQAVLQAGTILGSGAMGLLALLGISRPAVFRRPRVAVIATGSEVVSVETPLGPGAIRNSNSYMLAAQIAEAGAQAVDFGIVRDEVALIADRLANTGDCDLVVTTGGVSAGDYDLLADVYQQLGIVILFNHVAIKPGMAMLAGQKGGRLYIGLSGNPAAASVAFELLVRPVLQKMGGHEELWRPRTRARLTAAFGKPSPAPRFVWASCRLDNGFLTVEPLPLQGNGMLKSAVSANALVVVPANSPPLAVGDEAEVMLLSEV